MAVQCPEGFEFCIWHDEIADQWWWELRRDGQTVAQSIRFDDEWQCRELAEWIRVHAQEFTVFPDAF